MENAIYDDSPYKNRVQISRTQEWVCPPGVTKCAVFIQDGGNSGYYGIYLSSGEYSTVYNGGGACGKASLHHNVNLVPGQSYTITIGAGGVAPTISDTGQSSGNFNYTTGGKSSALGLDTSTNVVYTGIQGSIQEIATSMSGGSTPATPGAISGTKRNKYEKSGEFYYNNSTNYNMAASKNSRRHLVQGGTARDGTVVIYY